MSRPLAESQHKPGEWVSRVWRPTRHNIGHFGGGKNFMIGYWQIAIAYSYLRAVPPDVGLINRPEYAPIQTIHGYRVAQNGTVCFVRFKYCQILTDLQTYFTVRIRRTFVIGLIVSLKIPPHPQVCRYTTLWNVSVLKATVENKTPSATTHF